MKLVFKLQEVFYIMLSFNTFSKSRQNKTQSIKTKYNIKYHQIYPIPTQFYAPLKVDIASGALIYISYGPSHAVDGMKEATSSSVINGNYNMHFLKYNDLILEKRAYR